MKAFIALLGVSLILLAAGQVLTPTSSGSSGCGSGCSYCSVWTSPAQTVCTVCSSGFFLNPASCVTCGTGNNFASCNVNGTTTTGLSCVPGYFPSTSGTFTCTQCTTAGFATCTNNSYALSCSAGYYLTSSNTCSLCMGPASGSSGVLTGYTGSTVTGCTLCNTANVCIQCTYNNAAGGFTAAVAATGSTACTTPAPTGCYFAITAGSPSVTTCYAGLLGATAGATYTYGGTQSTVTALITNCIAYSGAAVCGVCSTGYQPVAASTGVTAGSSCVPCTTVSSSNPSVSSCTVCLSGYYSASGTCTACPTGCATCTSATACQSCVTTSSYYLGQDALCHAGTGPSNCLIANSSTACGACASTFGLNVTSTAGACTSCGTGCSACSNTSVCTTCATGYTINATSNTCYNSTKSANILLPGLAFLSAIFYFLF